MNAKEFMENQKWKADTIKELMISGGGGGNVPGEDGPYRKPPPSETPPYPPKELANFLAPSGTGKTLSDEAYWNGFQTIMETTAPGSDEQNKRLNILWHQFQDQVRKPTDGLKIGSLWELQEADKRYPYEGPGSLLDKNLEDYDKPMKGYPSDDDGSIPLVNRMKINPKVAMSDKMYRVTDWDKKQNNEAWKQFIKGNPNYFYKPIKGKA